MDGREGHPLSYAQQHPCDQKWRSPRRCCRGQQEREEGPQRDASRQHALASKPVCELPPKDLGEGIAEEERGEDEALEALRYADRGEGWVEGRRLITSRSCTSPEHPEKV